MPKLDAHQLTAIIGLIEPFVRTEGERLALVETVLYTAQRNSDIDFAGSPDEFARRLIYRLRDYGEIEPGKPALWALLDAIRPNVGADLQTQIDALRDPIYMDAAPTADFV